MSVPGPVWSLAAAKVPCGGAGSGLLNGSAPWYTWKPGPLLPGSSYAVQPWSDPSSKPPLTTCSVGVGVGVGVGASPSPPRPETGNGVFSVSRRFPERSVT